MILNNEILASMILTIAQKNGVAYTSFEISTAVFRKMRFQYPRALTILCLYTANYYLVAVKSRLVESQGRIRGDGPRALRSRARVMASLPDHNVGPGPACLLFFRSEFSMRDDTTC